MRAVAYIRVSDASQVDGYSLAAQERYYLEYCEGRDWAASEVYREEGVSARYESIRKRPVFQQLLDDAVADKFDVVIVHTLDRWARYSKVLLESVAILDQHNVGLVSITENLDWSTPEGRLVAKTLGNFSEFFSDMLAKHTKKGISERAHQGKQLGSIPFGYESCRVKQDGVRILQCKPEHPGGIHVHSEEGSAVSKLFKDYAAGSTTLSTLATWLNGDEFRTRNTKKLPDAKGEMVAEPRLFTTASVRGILHNPTYTGKVRHKDQIYPGLHDPLVSDGLFQVVQDILKRNSGRSETLQARPTREYLLKGLIHCAYCRMPMWAQTYRNGNRYYREQHGSRGAGNCVNKSGSIRCEVPDEQMGMIMGAIILPDSWLDRLLARIQLADEVKRVNRERKKVETRLRKLGQVYLDDDNMDLQDYKLRKKKLEDQLVSLQVPGLDAVQEAGKLLEDLPKLWKKADLADRRRILMSILEAVYIDTKEEKRVVAIKPKPAFRPIFEIAETRARSGIVLIKDADHGKAPSVTDDATENGMCFWWRRGRVELGLKHGIEVALAA